MDQGAIMGVPMAENPMREETRPHGKWEIHRGTPQSFRIFARDFMQPNKFIRLLFLCIFFASVAGSTHLSYSQVCPSAPFDVRCEYLTNPVGIDVRQPPFSRPLEDPDRGELHSAYQILVVTSPQRLARKKGG